MNQRMIGNTERVVIEPSRTRAFPSLSEALQYRELLKALVARDLKIRYKQTLLGLVWVVAQPFFAMVVFTIVLHRAVGIPSEEGIPYPIYTFSGLIFWQYFSESIARSSRSLVLNQVLVTKVFFPRIIAPLSGVVSPIIDLGCAFGVLIGMMVWYGTAPGWGIVLLPVLVVSISFCASAVGVGLGAMNVRYRDVGQAVSALLQLWMFLTPVFYATTELGTSLRFLDWINPMANLLPAIRSVLIGSQGPDVWPFICSMGIFALLFVAASHYFERVQRSFADSI